MLKNLILLICVIAILSMSGCGDSSNNPIVMPTPTFTPTPTSSVTVTPTATPTVTPTATPTGGISAWSELSPATSPSERYGHTMVSINGTVYMFGGYDNVTLPPSVYNDLWQWSSGSNQFSQILPTTAPPSVRYNHTAVVYQGKMYIYGGMGEFLTIYSDLWMYDPLLNSWQEITPSGTKPSGKVYHIAGVAGDKMIIAGGYNSGETWIYDFTGNSWSRKTDFPEDYTLIARAPCTVYNNKFYVFTSPGNTLYVYDPALDTWTQKTATGNVPSTVKAGTASLADNEIFICGGETDLNNPVNTTYKFNFSTFSWTSLDNMPLALSYSASTLLTNGNLLLFGGRGSDVKSTKKTLLYNR
ncbi:MAG: kelch repeat-containing protein [Candidatus Eremiobacterota bacterium]